MVITLVPGVDIRFLQKIEASLLLLFGPRKNREEISMQVPRLPPEIHGLKVMRKKWGDSFSGSYHYGKAHNSITGDAPQTGLHLNVTGGNAGTIGQHTDYEYCQGTREVCVDRISTLNSLGLTRYELMLRFTWTDGNPIETTENCGCGP